ncbi:alpha/beta hydrolase [Saccharospirillum mangrovi]|uniref:alpha/beta hydrolase n=1 Tax=Saccharospirillum mangrovi TaxID=2161747 RepID=UPI000D33BD59|nr:alpha/beta fold hydrolase [Saccharospirillum mangrovi]
MTLRSTLTSQDTSPAARTEAGPMPDSFRRLGRGLNALAWVSPALAGQVLTRLWFTPLHGEPGQRTRAFWASADRRQPLYLDPNGLDLHLWGNPKAPLILGVHGWRGSGSQFREWVTPLVNAGYQVCLFDLPGHGLNKSRRTHVYEFARVLLTIQTQLGQPAAVIAHSLGAQSVIQAMAQGFQPGQLALVAPGLDVNALFESFNGALGLNNRTRAAFERSLTTETRALSRRYLNEDTSIWQRISLDFAAPFLTLPGVLVMDADDREVPIADLHRAAAAWPAAESIQTRGLGHSGALKDAAVIRQLVSYFQRQL